MFTRFIARRSSHMQEGDTALEMTALDFTVNSEQGSCNINNLSIYINAVGL